MTTIRAKPAASIVSNFFDAKNRRDVEAMFRAFAPSATVRDEDIEYASSSRIRRWLEDITEKHRLTFKVIETTPTELGVVATVQASGDMAGSPFTLRYAFTLSGQTIARLEIDLAADRTNRSFM